MKHQVRTIDDMPVFRVRKRIQKVATDNDRGKQAEIACRDTKNHELSKQHFTACWKYQGME